MALLKQSTIYTRMFLMVQAVDHVSPLTGATVAVTLSKAGGAFGAAAGAVSEVSSGWYKCALTTADTNTLGELAIHATATNGDPSDLVDQVVAVDLADATALGLSRIDAAITTRSSHSAADVWAVGTRALTDKVGFSLSAAGVQAIWDALTSALTTAGSVGKRIADNLDAAISSRLATGGYTAPDNASVTAIKAKTDNLPAAPAAVGDIPTAAAVAAAVWAAGARTLTSFGTLAADVWASATRTLTSASGPTVAQIADGVWDELAADHVAAGSTGQKLSAAGSATDPLLNTVPGSYASGSAGYALGRIGSGQITTVSPAVSQDGGTVTIVRGDDYLAADGRALDWTDAGAQWPDLTGATIAFTARSYPASLTKAGSVVTPSGSGKKVRLELTAAETATLAPGSWDFDVQATIGGHIRTLVRGTMLVLQDQTHA